MMNILGRCFKRIKIPVTRVLGSKYSTSCYQPITKGKISSQYQPSVSFQPTILSNFEPNLRLTVGHPIIDLGLPQTRYINEIIDHPININANIIEPIQIPHAKEDNIPETSLNLPTVGVKIEKHAARLIVIRRRKMRKHKRRKLRKKMKFAWRKIKQRRELLREKGFHQELLREIRAAEQFDAKAYVASRLQILDNERIPTKYRGEILPEAMIRKFLKEKQDRRDWKKNIPRLTL